jgi:AcrR family transcriptional regulator
VSTQSRRERLRAEAFEEIKAITLRLLAEHGPGAISLRAIAREMGMTAGGLYGYYATRDDLITALIGELYTSLAERLEAALGSLPGGDLGERIVLWAEALRAWAIANPEGFQLIYGAPVAGYQPPPEGAAPEAERRMCAVLASLVAGAWPYVRESQPGAYDWADLDPRLAEQVRASTPDLPPTAVALALRIWGRVHGLLSLEINGHLGRQVRDPSRLYRTELHDLLRFLGLTPSQASA